MKKTILMSAMLFAGVAFATPQITTSVVTPMSTSIQEEKVKIEADALPVPVKVTITGDETVNKFPIAEAWQVTQADGTFHFLVTFANGTEEKLSKKYDKDGVEIKD